jgi:3-deoxy-manno-octulosonate cytidylyltransferase (CMP-KDO synthetase)
VPANEPRAGAIAVIPARYASTRLPAKALADIGGMPMVARVLARARLAERVGRVVVATDDDRIRAAAAAIGEVVMTSALHTSGSDRVAEVAAASDCEIVVNVQGDLPLLDPRWIDLLVERMTSDPAIGMATVAVPVRSREELLDPNAVKVVCDTSGRALYFSRAPIPYHRDDPTGFGGTLHHVGLYAYRRATLLRFAALPPTRLEQTEKLEQLRALENGIGIGVVVIDDRPPLEVDTPADLERARAAVLAESAASSS